QKLAEQLLGHRMSDCPFSLIQSQISGTYPTATVITVHKDSKLYFTALPGDSETTAFEDSLKMTISLQNSHLLESSD
ncbi:hypothetical protein ACQP3C_27735, partial [Escherichia coli]